ncbi:putative cuticle collagen 145 [Lontra canadensis]|uniref:putative cuticle collagen 145 n=1 Tax=Lontra canadensis TaxID=76717 RepID=UPI0013F3611F|nr:putative cuticle collagen 145 [Lontra canadensis]
MSCPARIPCANDGPRDPSPCPGPHPDARARGCLRGDGKARRADPTRRKGLRRGAPGSQSPGEGPPAARRLQVQSIDTAPRGEGAPSFSLAWRPSRSGPRPSLAYDPALGRSAARGPCTPAGTGKRPVGGRVGRRGRPRSWSRTQVAGAARPVIPYRNCRPQTGGTGLSHPSSRRPSTQPAEPTVIQVRLLPIGPTDQVAGTEDEISSQMSWGAREGGRGLWSYAGSSWTVTREPLLVNSTLPRLLH